MKTKFITLSFFCGLFFTTGLLAQTYTLNWASSYTPAWANGASSGTASNIGASGINCTTAITVSGGVFGSTAGATGTATPTVTGTAFVVGGSTANNQITMDFSANTQFTYVVYSFSGSIVNAVFNITDIDKGTATSTTYYDKVIVTATDGVTVFNPTITKYAAASSFIAVSGNTVNANTTSGQGGNSASSAADQNATAIVDFGTAVIKSITVRYTNAAGADANPAFQAIAIGNISFQKAGLLPVDVLQFAGELKNASVNLHWVTTSEINVNKYVVERSIDGTNFTGAATLQAKSGSTNNYFFTDGLQSVNSKNIYYRLQMIDADGKYEFSEVLKIAITNQVNNTVSISPNPANDRMNVSINSAIAGTGILRLISNSGQIVYQQNEKIIKGENLIVINKLQYLTAGIYTLQVVMGNEVMTAKVYKY